ncbi:8-oxoguanine glycosylase ogg1 [Gamsiella multidivaricata]|nr:8-oxoguanine glycosylase ogg1 [Gamsiella multidivaricata]
MTAFPKTTRKRALSLAQEFGVTARSVTVVSSKKVAKSSAGKALRALERTASTDVTGTPWTIMNIPRSELDLSTTLKCGQSFRWHRQHQELASGQISLPTWSCVLDRRLWIIQETEDGFKYRTFRPSVSSKVKVDHNQGAQQEHDQDQDFEQNMRDDKEFLRDYFQLDVPLTELYNKWSKADTNFKAKAPHFPGVRILRQDPVENLICFICSSNNNISRISQMATKLCQEYGSPITVPPEEPNESPRTFFGFPTIDALAQDGVEEILRSLGFGYRAKYIANTAKMISAMGNGEKWLMGLRNLPYEKAHSALLALQGVGPKVADCVCLMSLDKHNSIPVDTHVWQIAVRDYQFRFEGKVPKTISPTIYKAVGKHFVDLFGDYSGWAHSVLFAADLRTIEGRVKEGSSAGLAHVKKETIGTTVATSDGAERHVVKVKQEVVDTRLVEPSEEEQDSQAVRHGLEEVKLENSADPPLTASVSIGAGGSGGRRQSKRRRNA